MSLRQQKIIQTDDIKNFDDSADHEETQKELPKGETMFFSVNTACDKNADITNDKENQDDPSEICLHFRQDN